MRRFTPLITLFILWLSGCTAAGQLGPARPEPTAAGPIVGQPVVVSFPDLNADPGRYRDKLIRVTGGYTRLPPAECAIYSGPRPTWALVAGNLRLDALGLEPVLRLAPEGTELTLDGIWQQYSGPLGCGKEADDGVAWYLEALLIVQPNPLPVMAAVDGEGLPRPTATPGLLEPTVEPGLTQSPLPTAGTVTPTSVVGTIGPTGTVVGTATPTATATLAGLLTATPGLTGTITPGGTATTATATATPTPTPSGTVATPPGGLPTATPAPTTPGGYPGPSTVVPPYP
jgi:hypothetical protein